MYEKKLIRGDQNLRPKSLLLVGNGAVQGGWSKIIDLFRKPPFSIIPDWTDGVAKYIKATPSEIATSFLCQEVFLYNMARNQIFSSRKSDDQLRQYN
jgi:hypothetical protein